VTVFAGAHAASVAMANKRSDFIMIRSGVILRKLSGDPRCVREVYEHSGQRAGGVGPFPT
jgi:hypothetical protein